MKKVLQNHTLLSIILILVLMILAYAIWVPFLGFYREDWYVTWNGVARGASAFPSMYASERPMMGYLYATLYPLLGNSVLLWGGYAFVLRLLASLLFFGLLRQLWQQPPWLATLAAILFSIYPGFLQQTQPNCFQMHWHGMTLALLSMFLMVKSTQTSLWWQSLGSRFLALLATGLYPFTMEYYIGMEGTRVALLWYALYKKHPLSFPKAVLRFLKEWLPFGVVIAAFLLWRMFIFTTDRPTLSTDRLLATYSSGYAYYTLRFGLELVRDTVESIFLAWSVPLYNLWYYGDYKMLLAGVIFAVAGVGIFVHLWRFVESPPHVESSSSSESDPLKSALIIGFLGVVSALIPIVATMQDVRFVGRDDRFTLPASMGVAIFLAALLAVSFRGRLRTWVIGTMIFAALLTHYQNARYMIEFWQVQRQVWWQLSWRAPSIKRNTLLMVKLPHPFYFAEDYEIWAATNLIYYPDQPLYKCRFFMSL